MTESARKYNKTRQIFIFDLKLSSIYGVVLSQATYYTLRIRFRRQIFFPPSRTQHLPCRIQALHDVVSRILSGFMAKSHYTHGGGVNFLCLPDTPEFPSNAQGGHQCGSYVYGVEYEHWQSNRFFSSVTNHDALCAVCEARGRSQVLMIPARNSCPDGWTLEYDGILAADHHTHKGAEFICVSSGMESRPGGQADQNGGLLYVAEVACGSLPCPPYVDGYELSCVVCTK